MDKINKLSLPATILIASVILGGFYFISQLSKQSSIEKQQRAELQAKKDEANADAFQKNLEASQKADCVYEAQQNAIDLNKDSCKRGEYCIKGENMYLIKQYENAYNTCLQRAGLN